MAKKQTSRTKSSTKSKSNFFTKRNVLLGIAAIALAGLGIVLYSNAAVGDPPVEKTLYCNQGNCFETQVAGTQRAPQKALVRETSKQACASTGKEWALKSEASRKQSNQWVCLKGNTPNTPTPTLPDGFEAVNTACFSTAMPTGVTSQPNLVQIPGGNSDCLQVWTYDRRLDSTSVEIQGQFEVSPMILGGANTTVDEFVDQVLAFDGTTLLKRNDEFELDGQVSTRLKIKRGEDTMLVIVSPKPQTINGTEVSGLVLVARQYGGTSETGIAVKDTTDEILANWKWKD